MQIVPLLCLMNLYRNACSQLTGVEYKFLLYGNEYIYIQLTRLLNTAASMTNSPLVQRSSVRCRRHVVRALPASPPLATVCRRRVSVATPFRTNRAPIYTQWPVTWHRV